MTPFQRQVRARVIQELRDRSHAPSVAELEAGLDATAAEVRQALHALVDAHRLALLPDSDTIWMAHPFSALPTVHAVRIGNRRWYANCAWDGLAILALLGDGTFATRCPASDEPMEYEVYGHQVRGTGLVHFLVPARSFWDDIGFT